ncbi:tandem-95 repeat protein [Microbacterium resistens]|uniref:Ig-like domain-containing protein n=1 Tax=Microbacterium resistens TaxID=156977 RepID=UPI001C56ED34|nr:tandem-95 repeat protein [Microbacterium resistens]MBW1639964.1 tandem-95 repeat protein [Microbacterium resistens]
MRRPIAIAGTVLLAVGGLALTPQLALAAPGSPGVPSDPYVIGHEDFENGTGATATRIADYVNAGGAGYSTDEFWGRQSQCNGVILQYENTQFPSGFCQGFSDRNRDRVTQVNVRRLADVLGQVGAGVQGSQDRNTPVNGSTAETRQNSAVAEWTFWENGNPNETVLLSDPFTLPVAQGQRYYTISIDVAEVSCDYLSGQNNSRLDAFLHYGDGSVIAMNKEPIRACTDPDVAYYTSPDLPGGWDSGGAYVAAGRFYSDSAVLLSPEDFQNVQVQVKNRIGASSGNDFAIDNLILLDATPQLDKSFSPETVKPGEPATLTFTVTNSSDLAEKNGWSFTDALDEGLVVADEPNIGGTCQADVNAAPGSNEIVIADGVLDFMADSCTITVDVIAQDQAERSKTYSNGPGNVTQNGLNPPGDSTLTVEDEAPAATDDESRGNPQGEPVTVNPLANDAGALDPSTVNITDPATGEPTKRLVVPGEGVWVVDDDGSITFTPEDGFTGNPTSIAYTVEDEYGEQTGANIIVTYVPEAQDDEDLDNPPGTPVTVDVLANDSDNLDPSTVNITDPNTGEPTKELVVPGEGVWVVNDDGSITFTPEEGFPGNPTPIDYTVSDTDGNEVGATVVVTYLPVANDDESLDNEPGTPVTLNVLENDSPDLDPSTLNITDPATGQPTKRLAVPGEGVWTVNDDGTITFTPEEGFDGEPTPIAYTVEDADGNETGANVRVGYLPAAEDDEDLDNEPGTPVTLAVLGNDTDDLDPSTVNITDPNTGEPTKRLVVPGEGVWVVNDDGSITFTPEEGFPGDPTPIAYTVSDTDGNETGANVVVTYLPVANDDESRGNEPGTPVTVNVLENDSEDLDPSTLNITDPATGQPTKRLTVPGEGVWTVNDDGTITFTPEDGFVGDPTPIGYTVEDADGNETGANVVVTYLPAAQDDEDLDNEPGTPVTVDVLGNDSDNLDSSTVNITDPATGEPTKRLVVPGEGVWVVNDDGTITFTPEDGFTGNPTPIAYTVEDNDGNEVGANVVVTYLPVANDDESLNNPRGATVTVPVLDNDSDNLDPSTVNITDPDGNPVKTLEVPGEGVWTVNDDGSITFAPEEGFAGDPTPIRYSVQDQGGNTVDAQVIVTYVDPEAKDDESKGNTPGQPVTVPVLENDEGDLDPSTLNITDPTTGEPTKRLEVPGEGVWMVNDDGTVTFTPEEGFSGDPTPIAYTVEDTEGNETGANVIVTYLPEAVDDESRNNPQGSTVTVPVLDNDSDNVDPSTVNITDPDGKPVKELVVPGEGVWTVNDDGTITFAPEDGFTGNPTPIAYTVEDEEGNEVGANVVVTYLPEANDDESRDNARGATVTVPVLDNDSDNLDPSTVNITDPSTGEPVKELAVPGEGVWTVNDDGSITFTPEEGFAGDPTPIRYSVQDRDGNTVDAQVIVTYVDPVAQNDESKGNTPGQPVTVPVLDNDGGALDPSTLNITDPDGNPVKELVVPGEGTWTVNEDGSITFTPEPGFSGNPTPIGYTVEDTEGNPTGATLVVTYLPEAADDESRNNPRGEAVTVPVLDNDSDNVDPSTVNITDPDGNPVKELVVPGEGTWTVNEDGSITFTPEPGFEGDPTPIAYTVEDADGNQVGAEVIVTYLDPDADPRGRDDRSDGNRIGQPVTVPVLGNDDGALDPSTLSITDPDGNPVKELVVPGEGTWTVNDDGSITFTPEPGYTGNPTPIQYTVEDQDGRETGGKVTVTYLPEAYDDASLNNPCRAATTAADGTLVAQAAGATTCGPVTVDVLGNDSDNVDPSTVNITDPDGNPVKELVVPGEGTWTVNPDGSITFTPEEGFSGNPTPIRYTVKDPFGNEVGAEVVITYVHDPEAPEPPRAHDDVSRDNPWGPVIVSPLENDEGEFDVPSLELVGPDGTGTKELTVPGEGVWIVNPDGTVRFIPAPGAPQCPTPVAYRVTDVNGNQTGATISICYVDRPGGSLPVTGLGAEAGIAGLAGLALLALGGGAYLIGRRRQTL